MCYLEETGLKGVNMVKCYADAYMGLHATRYVKNCCVQKSLYILFTLL
jgi:hypothetical protein